MKRVADETLTVKITGDSESYEKAVKSAEKSTDSFSSKVSGFGSKVAGTLSTGLKAATGAIAGVSAALGAGVVAGVKYNASIEQYETSFATMTGSAEEAADIVARLNKIGAETPFEFTDLADTTNMLMQFGFTADDAIDSMQMLGDISQGSADKMGSIARAYAKMRSSQKVTLEDINMMIDAGFNPLQEISDQTGESMQSLYDRISEGSMSVDEVTAAMQRATSEGGKYYQSMQKQSQTINGMISTLQDNAQQLLGQVIQPISESFGTQLLPAAIDTIEELTTAFQTQGTEGLIQAGGQIIANLLLGIATALPGVITTALQVIQSLINGLSANLPQLMTAGGQILSALGNGILQLLPMLGTLALNIVSTLVSTLITNLPQLLSAGASLVSTLASGIGANLPQIISQATTLFSGFVTQIQQRLPELVQRGGEMISNLVNGLLGSMPEVIAQAGEMLTTWISQIISTFPDIMQSGADMILNLLEGLVNNAPQIISQAGSMLVDFIAMIGSHLPEILQKGIEIIGELLAGIISAVPDLLASIPDIISSIGDSFMNKDWGSIGLNIIDGIAAGVANAAGNLVNAAVNAAKNAIDTVKGWLGIASPSKRFRDEVGKFMALGMGVGFEENIPVQDINNSLDDAVRMISGHYADVGRQINPVDAIVGTSQVSHTYQSDVSNIFEGLTILIDNITNLDGAPIYRKASEYTIREINERQRGVMRLKGAY